MLLSDAVVKGHHAASSCRPLLSSISESTGLPGVVTAAEAGVWVHGASSRITADVVPGATDMLGKDSNVVSVNDAEVL